MPVWGGVRHADLYPDVDLVITSEGDQVVRRLAARPGADPPAVTLRVEGADSRRRRTDSVLRLSTTPGVCACRCCR